MIVRNIHPTPRTDKCIESLGDAVVFTSFNADNGYWQCEVDESYRDKTTFTSHMGLFRYIRMPSGVMNAPATFQRTLYIILSRVERQFTLVCLDDVIIFS